MTKGSLVVFEAIGSDDASLPLPGIVIKEPYGCIMSVENPPLTAYETKVVDVLFGARLVRKIPILSLRVIK